MEMPKIYVNPPRSEWPALTARCTRQEEEIGERVAAILAEVRTGGDAAKGRRVHLAAMLVEMIHVASLIHDDVIDESDTRRGRPSANARWQSHKAVILGDFILARNMNIGLSSGQFDLVTHVCGSMAALCEGVFIISRNIIF